MLLFLRLPRQCAHWLAMTREEEEEIATPVCALACNDRKAYDRLKDFRMVLIAPFSSRETWAWEMPKAVATSIWVFPS